MKKNILFLLLVVPVFASYGLYYKPTTQDLDNIKNRPATFLLANVTIALAPQVLDLGRAEYYLQEFLKRPEAKETSVKNDITKALEELKKAKDAHSITEKNKKIEIVFSLIKPVFNEIRKKEVSLDEEIEKFHYVDPERDIEKEIEEFQNL